MAVPRAVRQQTAAANQIIEQLGNPPPASADPEPNPAAPETLDPPAPASPTALAEPTSDPEAFQPLNQPLGDEDAVWSQRYKTLQGKYNAEVPRLRERIKELEQQLQHSGGNAAELQRLRDELAQFKARPTHTPAAPVAESISQIRQEYGDDFLNSIVSIVRQELAPVSARVDVFGQSVSKVAAKNRQTELADLVREAGIDFNQRNNDPLFIQWLDEVDAMSGVTRQQMLSDAYNRGDLQRAANFFTAYDGQASGSRTNPPPALDRHVRVPASAPQLDRAPEVTPWTKDRIDDFYSEKARAARGLKSKYSPEELARLERELFASMSSQNNA